MILVSFHLFLGDVGLALDWISETQVVRGFLSTCDADGRGPEVSLGGESEPRAAPFHVLFMVILCFPSILAHVT